MELLSLSFQKSTGNTGHKNKVLQWPWRNWHHMKSSRMQPSALGTHILPSLPAVILLTTLYDDATCLKSFSHLTTRETLSRIPWWLAQSGKFRNISDFWAAWASAGSCFPFFLLFESASAESISGALHFFNVQTLCQCLQGELAGYCECVGNHSVWTPAHAGKWRTEKFRHRRWSGQVSSFPFKSLTIVKWNKGTPVHSTPCPGEDEQQRYLYTAKQKTTRDHTQPPDLWLSLLCFSHHRAVSQRLLLQRCLTVSSRAAGWPAAQHTDLVIE